LKETSAVPYENSHFRFLPGFLLKYFSSKIFTALFNCSGMGCFSLSSVKGQQPLVNTLADNPTPVYYSIPLTSSLLKVSEFVISLNMVSIFDIAVFPASALNF